MAVPKKKTSKSKRDTRRAHDGLSAISLSVCPNCQESKPPHRVCPHCGWYRDREVLAVEE